MSDWFNIFCVITSPSKETAFQPTEDQEKPGQKAEAPSKPAEQKDFYFFVPFFGKQELPASRSANNDKRAASGEQQSPSGSEKSADNAPMRLPPGYSWLARLFETPEQRQARIARQLRESFRLPTDGLRIDPDVIARLREQNPPPEECGNGQVEEGEQCDGGANCDPVTCQTIPEPPPPRCGDGNVDAGEQCDGGDQCDPVTCQALPPPPPPSVFDAPITLEQMCKVFPALPGESEFAMGDFNNDGHQDLAVNRPDDGMAYVIMNIQQRCASGQRLSLEQVANIVFDGTLMLGFYSVTAMDANGDGIQDLLIGSSGNANLASGYLVFLGGLALFNIAENNQVTIAPDRHELSENYLNQMNAKFLAGLRGVGAGDQLKNLGDVFGNGRDYTSYASGNNDYCLIAPKDVLNDGSTVKTLNDVVAQVENREFPAIEFYDFSLNAYDFCRDVHSANITQNGINDFILAAQGKIYFVIGQQNMPSSIDLSNPQGVGVFSITQDNRGDLLGLSASVYDYTGDGTPDIVLASPDQAVSVDQNMRGGAGVTYVIPGEGIRAALASGAIQAGNNYTISQIVQITGNPAVISATQENGQFGRKGIAPVVVGHDAQNRPIIKTVVAASEYLPPQGNNVSGCLFVYGQGLQGPQWAEQAAVGTIEASDGVQRLGNTLESVDWNGDGEADGIGVTDDNGTIYFRADTQPSQ